jgi:hypothetical protein
MIPRMPSLRSTLSPLVLVASALIGNASAQCANDWLPGDGWPGVGGVVLAATTWDPDGPGPLPAQVVIGGQLPLAGSILVNRIVAWNPATGTWSALGSGIDSGQQNDRVLAMTSLPNGDLIAGGIFTQAGGVAANNIARWNGTSWSPLGAGLPVAVRALASLPNGDVVAGGDFTLAGGGPTNYLARWDGIGWSALGGGGGTDGAVAALTTAATGDLFAAGAFTTAGGATAPRVARWNGSSWSALGGGPTAGAGGTPAPRAILALPNGDVVVGGSFAGISFVGYDVQRWNGASWSPVGPTFGPLSSVFALAALPNGDLLAGGTFDSIGGVPMKRIARWNGASWSVLGGGVDGGYVYAMTTLPSGDAIVGGNFYLVGGVPGMSVANVARWGGASWSALSPGSKFTGGITNVTVLSNGDCVLGGDFASTSGVALNRIARVSGTAWLPMGSGMNGAVSCATELPNGDVVAGGSFTTAGGAAANRIAHWNGTTWSPMGAGMNDVVRAVTATPNGDVMACGNFTSAGGASAWKIARWNGANWSAMNPSPGGHLYALATLPNGDVVVGGDFLYAGSAVANGVARWDGSTWSAMATGVTGDVLALLVTANGDLVAGTTFTGPGSTTVWRWNGSTWTSLGAMWGDVSALAELPNGDIVAAGRFELVGSTPAKAIARWNGSTWSAVDVGLESLFGGIAQVLDLARIPGGDLIAVGYFVIAGGDVSAGIAQLTTTCPATAVASGNGCPSSAGNNTLMATTLPWVDATFRATATGLPPVAIVLELTSFIPLPQGLAPLTILFPQAGPGCDILTLPDILIPVVTTTGTVQSSLFLPNVPPLVGLTFYHQMVPIEVDALGAWVAVTATNALQLTVGAF